MDTLLEFIVREILMPIIKNGGPYTLFAAILATLFSLGGWVIVYIIWRLWQRDRKYWREMQTLRHHIHDELMQKVIQALESFVIQAIEQRKLIGKLYAGKNSRR